MCIPHWCYKLRLGHILLCYVALSDVGDMALWLGSAWYVTSNSSAGIGIAALLFMTGAIRIGVSLIVGVVPAVTSNMHNTVRLSAVVYLMSVIALFFVVLFGEGIWWLVFVESVRAIAITILRIAREMWLRVIAEKKGMENYSGGMVALTNTARVLVPVLSGAAIAAVSFEMVAFVMIGQATMSLMLAYFISGHIENHEPMGERGKNIKISLKSMDSKVIELTLLMFFANSAIAPLGVYLPTVIKYTYDAGVSQFGIGEALLGLGAVVGALIGRRISKTCSNWVRLLIVAQALLFLALALFESLEWLYVILLCLGTSIGAMQSGVLAIYLKAIPKHDYARIRSFQIALSGFAFPIGISVAGLLTTIFTTQIIPIFQALVMVLSILVTTAYFWRRFNSFVLTEE